MSSPQTEQRVPLSIPEIAARAGVPIRMAQRLVYERRVPVVKIGKHVRVWSTDLDAYFDANTRPAATQ